VPAATLPVERPGSVTRAQLYHGRRDATQLSKSIGVVSLTYLRLCGVPRDLTDGRAIAERHGRGSAYRSSTSRNFLANANGVNGFCRKATSAFRTP
jgi:hypothetical protein